MQGEDAYECTNTWEESLKEFRFIRWEVESFAESEANKKERISREYEAKIQHLFRF